MMESAYLGLAPTLFVLLLLSIELGRRLGRAVNRRSGTATQVHGAVESAVFALFGLLLAFTFSGAADRFDARKVLVVQEANAIGTAYLRLDLLDAEAQSQLRPLFKAYVHSRIAAYQALNQGEAAFIAAIAASSALQSQIWQAAVAGSGRASAPGTPGLVLPPMNDMIDLTSTRLAAMQMHPPLVIYGLLFGFALASALIVGYGMAASKGRSWLHLFLFSLCIASTLAVIIDLEHPRHGLIRVDAVDATLQALLRSMP